MYILDATRCLTFIVFEIALLCFRSKGTENNVRAGTHFYLSGLDLKFEGCYLVFSAGDFDTANGEKRSKEDKNSTRKRKLQDANDGDKNSERQRSKRRKGAVQNNDCDDVEEKVLAAREQSHDNRKEKQYPKSALRIKNNRQKFIFRVRGNEMSSLSMRWKAASRLKKQQTRKLPTVVSDLLMLNEQVLSSPITVYSCAYIFVLMVPTGLIQ